MVHSDMHKRRGSCECLIKKGRETLNLQVGIQISLTAKQISNLIIVGKDQPLHCVQNWLGNVINIKRDFIIDVS